MQTSLSCPPPPTRVFKRYANRKYYDPSESRYVNYEEIARVIREGAEVRVLESGTMQDVTGIILARILSREEKRASRTSPRTLSGLIRTPGAEPAPRSDVQEPAPSAAGEAERLLHALLSRGHRATYGARRLANEAARAVERLDQRARARVDAASEALRSLTRLNGQVARIFRRIDELHERLRALEGP